MRLFKRADKSASKIGAAVMLEKSIENTSAAARQEFYKPEYNPATRKAYYDDGEAHRRAIEDAFSDGRAVRDPYTGAELLSKQRAAKIEYGEEWQNHAAEADHIDPLSQFVNRHLDNPFLTTDDLKHIANDKDNFQVISRRLNQSSSDVGKGGSTQEEWADDSERMAGLSRIIENGDFVDKVKARIREAGHEAERRNDLEAFRTGVENAVSTAHNAGMAGAERAGVTAITMSGIMNAVSVIKGEKNAKEAAQDTLKAGGKAAVMGYTLGGGMTILNQTMSYSSSEFMQAMAEYNIPAKVISAIVATGDTVRQWGNGEISTEECMYKLGEKGLNMTTMGYSMAMGQAVIPIPIVGGAIGALVGTMMTGSLYTELINNLTNNTEQQAAREAYSRECHKVAEQYNAYRREFEKYMEQYFSKYRRFFNETLSSIQVALEAGDANGVIAGANEITRELGGEVKFENVEEFKRFLSNNEADEL